MILYGQYSDCLFIGVILVMTRAIRGILISAVHCAERIKILRGGQLCDYKEGLFQLFEY